MLLPVVVLVAAGQRLLKSHFNGYSVFGGWGGGGGLLKRVQRSVSRLFNVLVVVLTVNHVSFCVE